MIAANIMTKDILTINSDSNVQEAIDTIIENKIRQVIITDSDSKLITVVSCRSLMRGLLPDYITKGYLKDVKFAPELDDFHEKMDKIVNTPAKDYPSQRCENVSPDTTVMELAAIFVNTEKHTDSIIVVDDEERVLGIISPVDVFKDLCSTKKD